MNVILKKGNPKSVITLDSLWLLKFKSCIGWASAVMWSLYSSIVVQMEMIHRSIFVPTRICGHELWVTIQIKEVLDSSSWNEGAHGTPWELSDPERARSGTAAPPHREEFFEVAWAFGLDASLGRSTRHVPLGGDPRDALDVLVKTSLAGLVLPQRSPPRGAGGSGLGEGSLGVFASTAAWPYISQKKKKKKMERWILNVKPTFICSVNSSSNLYKTSQLLNSHKYIMCCIMPTFHSSFWTEKNKGCMSEAALLTSGPSSEDSGDWTAVRSGPLSTQLSLLFGVFMNISRPGCSVTSLRKMLDEAQEGNKKIEVFYI